MDIWKQGQVASEFECVDLDVEHLQIIGLKGFVTPLRITQDAKVVYEVHAQSWSVGCGRDALGIVTVEITACIDGGQDLRFLQQFVEGTDILENHTSREAYLVEK